jgi:hypothetical protein
MIQFHVWDWYGQARCGTKSLVKWDEIFHMHEGFIQPDRNGHFLPI